MIKRIALLLCCGSLLFGTADNAAAAKKNRATPSATTSGGGEQMARFNVARLDSLFDLLAQHGASGSVALYRNGEHYLRSMGYGSVSADQAVKTPMDDNTPLCIGSITKTFTATLIFQQIDAGKLSLDDTLARFYPTLPNASKITIRQMLVHRSGLRNYLENPAFPAAQWPVAHTRAQMLEFFEGQSPAFEPDTAWGYSNTAYMLLAFILEDVTGQSYEELLQRRICKPLGLKRTHGVYSADDATSLVRIDSTWNTWPKTDPSVSFGCGHLYAPASELVLFFRGLFGGKLVSAESLTAMKTLDTERPGLGGMAFGLGLHGLRFGARQGYGHTGGIEAFRAIAGYFPDQDLYFAVCCNSEIIPRDQIAIWMLGVAFGEQTPLPSFDKVIVDGTLLERYTGTYKTPSFPLAIAITRRGSELWLQGSGQTAIPLEAIDDTHFRHTQAGIRLTFDAEKNEMRLLQGGNDLLFTQSSEAKTPAESSAKTNAPK